FGVEEDGSGERIREMQVQFSTHQRRRTWRGGVGEGPRPAGAAASDGSLAIDLALEDQADLLIRLDGGAGGAATITGLSLGNPNHITLSADGDAGGFDWCQETADLYVERRNNEKALRHRAPQGLPGELAWMSAGSGGA